MRPPISAGGRRPVQAWRSRPDDGDRLQGRALLEARRRLYARAGGRCAACDRLLLRGWIRDHITPISEGGAETETNVQALCADCSSRKTQAEAARGRARR
jgi:5-methylcytosine-specific restriction protein A